MMNSEVKPLFFDWLKIVKEAKWSTLGIKNLFDKIIINESLGKKFLGNSFLLNPQPLSDKNLNIKDVVDYIGLAALRNYFDWEYSKDATLPIYFCELSLTTLKSNRLLRLEKEKIKFIYEEKLIWELNSEM